MTLRVPSYFLAIAAVLSVTLTGCAKGTGAEQQQSGVSYDSHAKLSGKLTSMGFGTSDEIATTRLALAKKALDGVQVKLTQGDLDIQQFLSSVAAGDPPDIIYASRDQIGTLASRGALMPLGDCIKGEGIDTSAFRPEALAQVTFNNTVYGIPEFNVVQIVQANADLLKKAGLTTDDVNGSSWAAVTAANKLLTKSEGGKLKVIGFDSKLPEFLPLWAKANGADLLSANGRKAQLDNPKVVQALKWAVGIYDAQGGFSKVKAYRDSADFFGKGNQFASGTLGAMPMEQWYINILDDVSPDAPMAFDTVRDRQGKPLAFASGSAWAIPAGSGNPQAACRFAKVMTQTSSWIKAAQARIAKMRKQGGVFTGLLTGNKVADARIQAMVKPGNSKWDAGIKAMYDANAHAFSMPANPAGDEFTTAWEDGVNRVLNGQQQPEQAMAQAQQEAQAALDKAWANWDKKRG